MKVFWLISITLPQVGKALGLQGEHTGGWITGQLNQMKNKVQLTVCTVNNRVNEVKTVSIENVDYIVLPEGTPAAFDEVLKHTMPDIVHIWGSEYAPVSALLEVCPLEHTLLSIQGLMGPCAEHLNDGVPSEYLSSCFLQRIIDRVIPGGLLDKQQKYFDLQAEKERTIFTKLRHVTGRTKWDKTESAKLAPNAQYYTCHETLRPAFYGPVWKASETSQTAPVLFLTQGNYPLKGLHRLLKAMETVVQEFPTVQLRIAGWPPLERGALLRPIIDWMFPYQRYTKKLIRDYRLESNIKYTGPLSEAEILNEFLKSNIFLLCSSIENSPNSLGEAMLLGMPCIASDVGGVSSMLRSPQEGLTYPVDNPEALADCILNLLKHPSLARECGAKAREHALITHDPDTNGNTLFEIYEQIQKCEA